MKLHVHSVPTLKKQYPVMRRLRHALLVRQGLSRAAHGDPLRLGTNPIHLKKNVDSDMKQVDDFVRPGL